MLFVTNKTFYLAALRIFTGLLADTIWGFAFVCVGISYAMTIMGVHDLNRLVNSNSVPTLLGMVVFFVLLFRLFVWLVDWLDDIVGKK